MSFMEETISMNIPLWDACAETPFICELKNGILPADKFKRYMIQDSIYLKHYASIYGKAIYLSKTLRDIQTYYTVLAFVTDQESAVRLNYLRQFGLNDEDIESIPPLPENQAYIDFLVETAERGDVREILMAVLPCMLSYSYVFRKVASEIQSRESQYWDFIQDYADDKYFEDCKMWCDFAEEKCGSLPPKERERLSGIFGKASELELGFWKMAYGDPPAKVETRNHEI